MLELTQPQQRAIDALGTNREVLFGGPFACGKTTLGHEAIRRRRGPAGLIVSNAHQARWAREAIGAPDVHVTTVSRTEVLWGLELALLVVDELLGWDQGHFEVTRRRLRVEPANLLVTASPIPFRRGRIDPIWWIRSKAPEENESNERGLWAAWLDPTYPYPAEPGETRHFFGWTEVVPGDGVSRTYISAGVNPWLTGADDVG